MQHTSGQCSIQENSADSKGQCRIVQHNAGKYVQCRTPQRAGQCSIQDSSAGQCRIVRHTEGKYGQFRALQGSAAYRTAVRTVRDSAEVEVVKLNSAKIYRFLQLLSHSRGFFARV